MSLRAGYSTMEVLIAFAVMAAVLSLLLPGQSALLQRSISSNDVLLATDYAVSRMDTLGISQPISPGVVQYSYRDWTIRQSVTRHSLDGIGVYEIQIEVSITRGRHVLAQLSAYKADQ